MTPRDQAIKDLSNNGYEFDRHGGKHDVYYNPSLQRSITVKRGKFTENTLRYIRKEIKDNQSGRG